MPENLLENVLGGIEESCGMLSKYPFEPLFTQKGSLANMPMGCARKCVLHTTNAMLTVLEKTGNLSPEMLLAAADKIEAKNGGDTSIAECTGRIRKLADQPTEEIKPVTENRALGIILKNWNGYCTTLADALSANLNDASLPLHELTPKIHALLKLLIEGIEGGVFAKEAVLTGIRVKDQATSRYLKTISPAWKTLFNQQNRKGLGI